MNEKKVKIVATIGPASSDPKILSRMIKEGLNVARMNFSHGTHEDHLKNLKNIRAAAELAKKPIAILQDLSGPKIRIGDVENNNITLVAGKKVVLTTESCLGTAERLYVNYKKLPQEIGVGNVVKIEDGKKELRVEKIVGNDIHCVVVVGGKLSSKKGVNLPDVELSISSLTAKDKDDVLFGIKHKVDYIAFSFVQTAKDVHELRAIVDKHKSPAKIIAKIETTPSIKYIDEIIEAADGIMVARGDMAVECGAEKVPMIQKMIIEKCNLLGKTVITATQMLDSMEKNPVPTRAEASDIANAILDGTDAIMLSGESAMGDYPVESVAMMTKIALQTEPYLDNFDTEISDDLRGTMDSLAVSAVRIANHIDADAIVCITESGDLARAIARHKPFQEFVAVTGNEVTFGQLQMVYGCRVVKEKLSGSTKTVIENVQKTVKATKFVKAKDTVVVVGEIENRVSGIFVSTIK